MAPARCRPDPCPHSLAARGGRLARSRASGAGRRPDASSLAPRVRRDPPLAGRTLRLGYPQPPRQGAKMDEILITPSTVANQPAIAGFRGTQFVAVWEDGRDGSIKGHMLSAAGKKTSDEFRVNFFPDQPTMKRRLPAILETAAGFVA